MGFFFTKTTSIIPRLIADSQIFADNLYHDRTDVLKELMLIKQANQKSEVFFISSIF